MNIQYLGTAAAEAWPGIFCTCPVCREAMRRGGKNLRTRSQALIDGQLLVDFPPDSYLHMLVHGLPLPDITDVLLTHAHQDHFYPQELIMRGHGFSEDVKGVLTLYGDETGERLFRETLERQPERRALDTVLAYRVVKEFVPFPFAGYTVTPLLANHDKRERCLIYSIEREGKRLLYANDTGIFPEATFSYLKGQRFDLISMDCTTGQHGEGTNHMGLPDNIALQRRLYDMGCAGENTQWVITHFSHHGGLLHEQLEEAGRPYGFIPAYDGMTVSF